MSGRCSPAAGAAKPRHPLRFLFALFLVLTAFVCRLAIFDLMGSATPYGMFTIAVVLAAYWLGLGPAVLATVLGAVLGNYFAVTPGEFGIERPGDALHIAIFIASCLAIALVIEALRRRTFVAQAAMAERQRLWGDFVHVTTAPQSRQPASESIA